MIPDFQNFTLEHCKRLVLEYQKTKDVETFRILLAKFDLYILYVINKFKMRYNYLRGEDPQELYHTGIIGFQKGLLSLTPELDPFFVLLNIKDCVRTELKQTYSYKSKELSYEVLPEIISNDDTERDFDVKLLCDYISDSSDFSDRERKLLILRFKDGKEVKEIAKELGCSEINVYKRLESLVQRVKVLFSDSFKDFY